MPRRPGCLLVPTLVLLTTVTSIVSSLGAPLVPALARAAGVPVSTAQWTLTATLLVGAVSTPIAGRLGGNRHRRTVILVGVGLVALGALLAALPLGFGWLLVGRALQGVGIGLTPLAMAVAREFVPGPRVAGTIALLSVTTAAGAGLGYPVTTLVVQGFGLAAAYWLAFVICTVTLAVAYVVLPLSASNAVDLVDWWGALLLATSTAGLLLAVSQGDPWGWGSPRVLGLALICPLLLIWWVVRTLRSEHPLVNLRLAVRPGALAANVTAVTAGIAVYVMLTMVILAVQSPTSSGFGLGSSVAVAGLMLVPYSVTTMAGGRSAHALSRRLSREAIVAGGCTVYLVATLALAFWHETTWQLLAVMALGGLGSGCTFGAMPGLIVRAVPEEETGSAMAFNHLLRFVGFAAGSAIALALLEVFRVDGRIVDRSFTAVALVDSGIWGMTVLLAAALAFVGAPRSVLTQRSGGVEVQAPTEYSDQGSNGVSLAEHGIFRPLTPRDP